jgi:hypothetical protein
MSALYSEGSDRALGPSGKSGTGRRRPCRSSVRGLAIVLLVLTGSAVARADAIWCGTFADERRPIQAAPLPALRSAAGPDPAVVRVRVEEILVDGAPAAGAMHRRDLARAIERCLEAGDVGRGTTFHLDLLVGADGSVIDARVQGEPRGTRCVVEGARALRFPRGDQPRSASARVLAATR